MKKSSFIRFVLIICTIGICLTACGKKKPDDKQNSDTSGYTKVEPYTDDTVKDMKGYEFVIVSPFIHDDVTGQALTTAEMNFEKRRREIEAQFNCKIKIVKHKTNVASIAPVMLSGDKLGDLVQFDLADLFQAIGSGYIRPLDTIKGIDASDERWIKGYTKLGYYKGSPYGLYFWRPEEVRGLILYNKTLLKQYGINENLPQLVREGKWTFDKFREIAIACTRDTDGDGIPNTYGVLTSTPEKLGTDFMHANNASIATIADDGKIVESFQSSQALTAMNYLYNLVNVDKVFYIPAQWTTKKTYYAGGMSSADIYANFTNNKVAFCVAEAWIANQIVRPTATSIQYGILPMPKGPDASGYVSSAHYALLFAVTNNNTDVEKVVPIINALGLPAEGYQGEDWINDAIEMDFCQPGDKDSVEMYKLCYERSYFDIGLSVQSIYEDFSEIVVMMPVFWGQSTPAAQLDAFKGVAKAALDNLYNK